MYTQKPTCMCVCAYKLQTTHTVPAGGGWAVEAPQQTTQHEEGGSSPHTRLHTWISDAFCKVKDTNSKATYRAISWTWPCAKATLQAKRHGTRAGGGGRPGTQGHRVLFREWSCSESWVWPQLHSSVPPNLQTCILKRVNVTVSCSKRRKKGSVFAKPGMFSRKKKGKLPNSIQYIDRPSSCIRSKYLGTFTVQSKIHTTC